MVFLTFCVECGQVLGEGLRWNEIQWAAQSVCIRDTEYVLMRAIFLEFERDEPKE